MATTTDHAIEPESVPATSRWRRVLPWSCVAMIVAGYAVFAVRCFIPACPESDTAGYLLLARRLAAGRCPAVHETDPLLCHDHHFVENPRGETVPKYAPGQPALMAFTLKLCGERAAFALNPIFGGLSLIGAFLLFRLWSSSTASVFALLVLASDSLFLFYTNYPLAHATDLCLVTWGMFFLWRWLARPCIGWGVAAGLALGYAQLVRPSSAVLVLAVAGAAAVAWFRHPRTRPLRTQTAVVLLAYGVFPVVHMLYNAAVFGSPFLTGYGLSAEQSAFSAANLVRNLPYAAAVLMQLGPSLCVGVGLVGILTERDLTQTFLKLLWLLPTVLLYGAYYWAPRVNQGGYGRFFLPVTPLLVGSAFALTERCCQGRWRRRLALAGLCGAVLLLRGPDTARSLRHFARLGPGAEPSVMAADAARRHLPAGSVVFAAPPTACHLGTDLDYRVYDLSAFQPKYVTTKFENRTDSKVLWQTARLERFLAFYKTHSGRLDVLLLATMARFVSAGRPVYAILPSSETDRYRALLGAAYQLEQLTEWSLPNGRSWAIHEVKALP